MVQSDILFLGNHMNAIAQTYRAPEPLRASCAFDGIRVTAACIPPTREDLLYTGEESFRFGDSAFKQRRAEEIYQFGARTILAPNVSTSSTRILNPDLLTVTTKILHDIEVRSNPDEPGDVLPVDPCAGSTCYMSMAGCGAVVMLARDANYVPLALVIHLSRLNSFDHEMVRSRKKSREHEGILHAAAAYFDVLGVPRSSIKPLIFFPIAARIYQHGTSEVGVGGFNRKMQKYLLDTLGYSTNVIRPGTGEFSLPAYLKETSEKLGFQESKSVCTLPPLGGFAHTRHANPYLRNAKNRVLIKVETTR
ncbi:MAG: hypothetical protein AB202_03800 [Parcubacteria bacterium C7867-007]|nr:MAG: hypothetical protein AB202_03800 [Parcubacteria bacterium C7867-007]